MSKFIGGLIFHYFHDPIQLEIALPYSVFVTEDDSDTKLSMEIFQVIFIFWAVGMALGLFTLLFEKWVYKKKAERNEIQRLAKQRPKVAH